MVRIEERRLYCAATTTAYSCQRSKIVTIRGQGVRRRGHDKPPFLNNNSQPNKAFFVFLLVDQQPTLDVDLTKKLNLGVKVVILGAPGCSAALWQELEEMCASLTGNRDIECPIFGNLASLLGDCQSQPTGGNKEVIVIQIHCADVSGGEDC